MSFEYFYIKKSILSALIWWDFVLITYYSFAVCNKWIHEVSQEFKRPCGKTVASEDVYEDEYMPPY